MTLDQWVNGIKNALVVTGVRSASAYLTAQLPFLKWPILNGVLEAVLTNMFEDIYSKPEMAAFFKYIDVRVTKQGKNFEKAVAEHLQAKLTGNKEKIKNAENELWLKFADLARLTS